MYGNIIDRRIKKDGKYHVVLEISAKDYKDIYESYNNEIAQEIINNHLHHIGDDGRPLDVRMHANENSPIVRIHANMNYVGNDHTSYT